MVIIDWHRAQVVPAQAAFWSPSGMLNLMDYATGHTSKHEVTFADILEGMGHAPPSNYLRNGRLQHLFFSY